jgi:hypothetical protein
VVTLERRRSGKRRKKELSRGWWIIPARSSTSAGSRTASGSSPRA